jgi:hypothetical protein
MGDSHGLNGLNGAGAHEPDEEDELSLEELAAPPQDVAELAASCVRYVGSKYKVGLDFTEDTLSLVDQYAKDARAEITVRPESAALLAAAIGAYLGEVIRRRFGGYWRAEGDHETWRVLLSRVYLSFNPIGMALEALTGEDVEGWNAHFELDPGERELVDARLAALPPVEEEEFFMPTTRMEVVHVVYEAIRAHMRDNGNADVRFGPEDYR